MTETSMTVNLKDLNWYFLNTDIRTDRRQHMEEILSRYNLKFQRVESPKYGNRYTSGALGMAFMIKLGLSQKPFKPFIIMEDDCSWLLDDSDPNRDPKLEVEVPKDADVLHLGISNAFSLGHLRSCGALPLKKRHPEFKHLFRVYNMFSLHAVLVLTQRYCNAFFEKMVQAARAGFCWDTYSVVLQCQFNIYALERPLLYQDAKYGGQEKDTKVDWSKDQDTIPESFNPEKYYNFKR